MSHYKSALPHILVCESQSWKKFTAETLAVDDPTPFHDVSLVRIFSFAEEISEGTSNCFLVTRCEVST